jgi:type IX secretion system PorP/SprF family membrane protein
MIRKILPYILVFSCGFVEGQDAQFSQFYANPLYHNPAFTGEAGLTRFATTARNQWPDLTKGFTSYTFSVDSPIGETNNAVGVQVLRDDQFRNLLTNSASVLFSKTLYSIKEKHSLTLGSKVGWVFQNYGDLSNLKFADQFQATSSTISLSNSNDPLSNFPLSKDIRSWNYFDASFGAIWRFSDQTESLPYTWAGFTANHLQQIFSNRNAQNNNALKPLLGLQFGRKTEININTPWENGRGNEDKREESFSWTVFARKQGNNYQLDAGINVVCTPIILGAWYRNMPINRFKGKSQRDALVFIAGFQYGHFLFEYSRDATISTLSGAVNGANEITIWYGLDAFIDLGGNPRKRQLRCSNF